MSTSTSNGFASGSDEGVHDPGLLMPAARRGAPEPAGPEGEFTAVTIKSEDDTAVKTYVVAGPNDYAGHHCNEASPASPPGPAFDTPKATILVQKDVYPKTKTLVVVAYFRKMRGGLDTALTRPPPLELFFSWLGAFLGILLVAGLNEALTPRVNLPLLVASFGASAVLIFGVVESKMAQPRNFLGGQVISAIVGCAVRAAIPGTAVWISTALGMSLALLLMQLTCTTHPPGGATALIAASAQHLGPWHGFQFVVTVFFGCLGMLVVALLVNNISPKRRYPTFWW